MALDAGRLIFVAYDRHTVASSPSVGILGTLTDATDKQVMVEDNGIGSGSFTISPLSAQAAWCTAGNYIRVWRDVASGTPLAAFWLEGGDDDILSPDEQGGLAWRRAGQGPLTVLREGIVWHRSRLGGGVDVVREKGFWRWRDSHPARVLIRLLREAQDRGALPFVDWDFTASQDTDGNDWADDASELYKFDIGQDLLSVVEDLRETGLHVEMGPNFVLHAWDDYDNDVSDTVDFTAGDNIRDVAEREVAARRSRSAVLVEGDNEDGDTRYEAVEDEDIEDALGRRKEGYFRFERTATPRALRRVGRRRLRKWRKRHDGVPTLGVIDTTGRVAFEDYRTGDTVEVHVPGEYEHVDQRIVAITLVDHDDGTYDPIVELVDLEASHEADSRRDEPSGKNDNPQQSVADTSPHTLDDFDRVVPPPAPTEGDDIAVAWEYAGLGYGQEHGGGPWFTYGAEILPVLTMLGTPAGILAVAGDFNHGWPSVPCGIGYGAWSGWHESESWAKLTLPASPDGATGVFVTVSAGGYTGAAGAVEVRASSGPPTKPHDGALVGRIEGDGSVTVFTPIVGPADLWIGLCAGWYPDYGIYGQGWRCVGNPVNPKYSGELNSGAAGLVGFEARKWAMSDVTVDLGQTQDPGGQGPWTWGLAGTEGSPAWEMDGSALVVEGNGGVGLVLHGEGEDEDEPYGLWSDVALGVEFDLTASDLSGGSVEVVMTGQGRRAVATLDLTGAVSVGSPTTTVSGDVTLAPDTLLTFALDTRSGDVRAKAWVSTDVEPAAWDAEVTMAETDDDADSMSVWVRAADGQTIRIERVRTLAVAGPGQRVVNEWIGAASGLSDRFQTRHRFRAGTLTAQVECNDVGPSSEDGGAFRLDYLPTAGMAIRADYTVEGD